MPASQADIQALERVIRQLSHREREELAEWICEIRDTESCVAEAAACPYGARIDSDRGTDDLLVAWQGYSAAIAALEQTSEYEAIRAPCAVNHRSSKGSITLWKPDAPGNSRKTQLSVRSVS